MRLTQYLKLSTDRRITTIVLSFIVMTSLDMLIMKNILDTRQSMAISGIKTYFIGIYVVFIILSPNYYSYINFISNQEKFIIF